MHADLNFKTCENYLYIEGEKMYVACMRNLMYWADYKYQKQEACTFSRCINKLSDRI